MPYPPPGVSLGSVKLVLRRHSKSDVYEIGTVRSPYDRLDIPQHPRIEEPHYAWDHLTRHTATRAGADARCAAQCALWLPLGLAYTTAVCPWEQSDGNRR